MNWLQKIAQSVSINSEEYENNLRAELYRLSDSSQGGEYPFSRQEADSEINSILAETQSNMNIIVQLIQQAVSAVSWSGTPVVVKVGTPPEEMSGGPDYLKPVTDAYVEVGGKSGWGGAPGFTVFMHENTPMIEDVLQAGDEDFFTDSNVQQDYFNLVRELMNPGSGQSEGSMTLYTARPVKDRATYENAQAVPSNLFMTKSYSRAEGISMDLGGSSGVRDIWKVRIENRYLIETLEGVDYQVVGEGMVPVKSIQLVSPGESR